MGKEIGELMLGHDLAIMHRRLDAIALGGEQGLPHDYEILMKESRERICACPKVE
jgi:hypothetical protein